MIQGQKTRISCSLETEIIYLESPGTESIEAPLGENTAAHRFWSKEACDKNEALSYDVSINDC